MAELRFFKIYQIIITLIHVKGQEIGMKLDESTPKYLKVSWSYGRGKDWNGCQPIRVAYMKYAGYNSPYIQIKNVKKAC